MAKKLGYIHIEGWMREELDLKGNELLVYALIHGFSQEEQGCFFGSLDYISRMCGCGRNTTIRTLKSLVEQGLLHKKEYIENNVKECRYTAIFGGSAKMAPVSKWDGGSTKMELGGSAQMGLNNKTLTDNKSIRKSEGTPAPLNLPFSSEKFKATWEALCEEKEWKKKTRNALQLTLNKLAKYHEDFAIELMEATIESGKWQRVVFPDTDAKYQEWTSARQQKIDNAVPRQAQQNKPRKIDPNNNVDAMYARLRAQKEAEERELREQLRQQYGDAYRPSGSHDDV